MTAPGLSTAEVAVVARFDAAPEAEESLRNRVARAMWDEVEGFVTGVSWEDVTDYRRFKARRQADAAIAVMRGEQS